MFPQRGYERAKYFLAKAKECPADSRVDFEAYLEASIIFARSAIHRVKARYEKEAGFKNWWDSLEDDPSVKFFRNERNWILKKGSAKLGQKLIMPFIKSRLSVGGQPVEDDEPDVVDVQTITSEKPSYASELYYYGDDPSTPATQTVEDHLNKLEGHINAFLNDINNS